MSITTNVTVEIGTLAAPVDFTSRVLGASTSCEAPIGRMGRASAAITLDNDDGALTPGAGGTYSAVDWFAQGVYISATVGTHTPVLFHGVVTNFDLIDDGVNSSVTITAMDALTLGGSAVQTISTDTSFGGDNISMLVYFVLTNVIVPSQSIESTGVPLPRLGNIGAFAGPLLYRDVYGANPPHVVPYQDNVTQVANDYINTTLMPSGPNVLWPTTVSTTGLGYTEWEYQALGPALVFNNTHRVDYEFAAGATAGELPCRALRSGFTNESLINHAVTQAQTDAVTFLTDEVTNDNSIALYGDHAAQLSALACGDDSGYDYGVTTLEAITQRWANVRADSEFTAQEFQVTSKMCDAIVGASSTSEQRWAQLLDIEKGLWQYASVTHTPAGAASPITDGVVIWRRRIDITPSDVVVTVGTYPKDYTSTFLLDDSVFGVLDENRLQ